MLINVGETTGATVEHLCTSCGHPVHHCVTAGQTCPVQTLTPTTGEMEMRGCPCPSQPPASDKCACKGSHWWLRYHGDATRPWGGRCDDDYPCDDPNVCHFLWDGLPDDAKDGTLGHELYCHKRGGHAGHHSTHNDCGESKASGWTCGNDPGADGGPCDECRLQHTPQGPLETP
jgi:hypothetical protein